MPIITDNDNLRKYTKFIESRYNTSFMQDPSWAKVKDNWKHFYVYLEDNGNIIIGMTVLIQSINKINQSIMYCPRGPIGKINDEEVINKLLNELKPLIKEYNVFMLKCDPNIPYNEATRNSFRKVGFKISKKHPKRSEVVQPMYYMILNLNNKTEEEVLESFSQKTRYNIRLSYKKEIKVTYSNTEESLKIFYELFKITTERDKFPSKSFEYFKKILQNFDKNHIRIYTAWYEDKPLASAITIKYSNEVFYLYGASSNENRNLMPTYALQWEMIKWGIENKCKTYNFGGLASDDRTTGLYKFKEGFCRNNGMTEYVGEFTKVYNKFYYLLYEIVYPQLVKINSKKLGLKIK